MPAVKAPKQAATPAAKPPKQVTALSHDEASRKNIPTAELQAFIDPARDAAEFKPVRFERARPLPEGETRERDADLDPQIVWNGARMRLTKEQREALIRGESVDLADAQLVWRGKDRQDWSDLVVQAPPIYVQEKIKPQAIIADLKRHAGERVADDQLSMFADFNGIAPDAKTEFYAHDQHWSNRMILGDSLQVMASLAEREALRGKVQCIYFDPPYGIKFNSNWQVSTQSRDVKDGKQTDVSREPEQVKAFRDTWKDGIHSYLTYLRDRLTVMRELLTESGSIFVQIGDENVHRVRELMDEVFGPSCFVNEVVVVKTTGVMATTSGLHSGLDYILWYGKTREIKFREPFQTRTDANAGSFSKVMRADGTIGEKGEDGKLFRFADLLKAGPGARYEFAAEGSTFSAGAKWWGTPKASMERLVRANRVKPSGRFVYFVSYEDDFAVQRVSNLWTDTTYLGDRYYVVQTGPAIVQRCILMTTDPGDLILDPTCGSGTTAYVAEQWGRRWVTIDTSRVALALARTRMMSARYPYYLLSDSPEGRRKEQEVSGKPQPHSAAEGDIRQGFVYGRVPHIMQSTAGNNADVDVIWEAWQAKLEPLRERLNILLGKAWEEWEVPREIVPFWPGEAKSLHMRWWKARIARQQEIDASIAKRADVKLLYDRPYEDQGKVRVAGPFTVESLSPHRIAPADEIVDETHAAEGRRKRDKATAPTYDFAAMVLENLNAAGVQGRDKVDKVKFTSLAPWPGKWIGGAGAYLEGEVERRAAVFIGPEFGTCSRADLVSAAREAADARFDVLVACAFAYDAHASELTRLGPLNIVQAKMNPDLHMADDLKATGKGNLFVVFGEPDIDIERLDGDALRVRVKGVDVFDPNTGDIRSDDTKGIAAWFIDTDYDEESFFVRHAYFLGANDPYKSLKTALKADIDETAWSTLYSDTSRPFARPNGGRIAVKVINHFGDEVMKVYGV